MTGSQILARLFRDSIRPYASRLVSSLFFMIIIALSTGATAWLLDPAIDKIFLEKDESMLLLIPIAIILTLLIKSVATYIQVVLLNGVAQNVIADTQIKLFKKIINADLSWLHKIHSAKIISNFLYDVTLLQDSVSSSLANGVKDLLTLICLLGVMYYQDWQLATIAIIAFPLVGVLTRRLGKRVKKASTETQEETGILASILSENLDGTRIVKAYQQEEKEIEKLSNSVWRRVQKILRGANARGAASPFAEFLAGFGLVQALPGPMFSFAAYAGGLCEQQNGINRQLLSAMIAGWAIFIPGTLLLFLVHPFWGKLKTLPWAHRALRGINAVASGLVSGVFIGILIDISWTPIEIACFIISLVLLISRKVPAPFIVFITGFVYVICSILV